MAAPTFGATDVLSLGASWEAQGSDSTTALTRATVAGSTGDDVAQTGHNSTVSGSVRYIYTGVETAFVAALVAANAWPGNVVNSLLVTGVSIDYSPCAAGKRPVVTFTYRDGPASSTIEYITDLVLPTYTSGAVAVPDILTVTAGSAETQNAQWSLNCQFGEDLDSSGEFLAGEVYKGEETLTLTFAGEPTSVTSTGWIATSTGANSTNTGYNEGNAYTYVRYVTQSAIA